MPDSHRLVSGQSGRDFYADLYSDDLKREAEWLRRGARPKVDSVSQLLDGQDIRPEKILEVGAGTGAVIGELRQRNIGSEHFAVDFSEEAIGFLREQQPGIQAAVADIMEDPDPFGEGPYDVVVVSHVIEHLEAPGAFLSALRRVPARVLVAEVPLEDLAFGRLKGRLFGREDHPAGHVQFFTRATFEAEVEAAGWTILGRRTYLDALDAETFAFAYGEAPMVRRVHKALTERLLPRWLDPLWTRLYHAHHAVVCRSSVPNEATL